MSMAVESILSRSIKVEVIGDLNSCDIVIELILSVSVTSYYFLSFPESFNLSNWLVRS